MLKLNKKGFALVETLIVSVIVMVIFSILYTNFFPMMGEYERREGYDDIDSIYKSYLIKTFLETSEYNGVNFKSFLDQTTNENKGYYVKIFEAELDKSTGIAKKDANWCGALVPNNDEKQLEYCRNLFYETGVNKVYITKYNLSSLKQNLKKGADPQSDLDSSTKDYIDTLPYYSKVENNNGYSYRIIVEYVKYTNINSEAGRKELYSFSTIGVDL